MLDRVSTVVLGLDGQGGAGMFADYSQWESWLEEREQKSKNDAIAARPSAASSTRQMGRKKLSYLEAREYEAIEQRVADAEHILQTKREQLEAPAIVSDGPRLMTAHAELEQAQETVDALYARWAELEKKKN
jgi:ATP-binding cassette subfamily F protein uup